jgi:hypothetical protein
MPVINDTQFKQVALIGGGYVCALRISADGLTRVHKTDVSPGGYIWKNPKDLDAEDATGTSPDFRWVPALNEVSMAAENVVTVGKWARGNYGNGYGCHDILFAPSDPKIIYMIGPGLHNAGNRILKSTDRGKTFAVLGSAGVGLGVQGDPTRMWGPKAGVNPHNANHLIYTVTYDTAGVNEAGALRQTTDGGLTSSTVATFPASTGDYKDKSATAVHWCPVNVGIVYAFRQNTGLYKSTDSGATWIQVNGGPTKCRRLHVDKFGQVWVGNPAGAQSLWRLDGATWRKVPTPSGWLLDQPATNPLSASKATNQVSVCSDSGGISHSYDNGATWTGVFASAAVRVATDAPWMADCNENYMTSGELVYDTQIVSGFPRGRLWFVEGIGVWYGHPRTDSGRPIWTELTRGNEELIPEIVLKPPGLNRPCYAGFHDRAWFAFNSNASSPPVAQLIGREEGLQHVYSHAGGDYAGLNPAQVAFSTWSPQHIFYIIDNAAGGHATVTRCPSDPYDANAVTYPHVAVSAAGIANMVVCGTNAAMPKYTTNAGSSWADCSFSGGSPNPGLSYPLSDKITAGVFWIIDHTSPSGGIWKSSDSGATFTKINGYLTDMQYGRIRPVPDRSNELWFFWLWQNTNGGIERSGRSLHPYRSAGNNAAILRRSTDGGANWINMGGTGWTEIHALGFGKASPGGAYPTLYALGCRTGDPPSIYRSTDMASTWGLLQAPYGEYPTGQYDAFRTITGDMDVYGDVWIGTASTGVIKGSLAGTPTYTRIRFR